MRDNHRGHGGHRDEKGIGDEESTGLLTSQQRPIPLCALCALCGIARAEEPRRIGRVEVEPQDIYDLSVEDNILFRAANFFHIRSREGTIRNELLFQEGEALDPEALEETERNLRGLTYLSAASVTAYPLPDGTALVRVRTRDLSAGRFCWNCRKPLPARAARCPFCGENQ